MTQKYVKDPDAILDYGFDWTDWLSGDLITTSTWFVATPPLVEGDTDYLTIQSNSFTTTTTKVWLAKGDLAVTYGLTNRITTQGGRTQDQTVNIQIKEL